MHIEKSQQGFTLIELVAVIVILGILTATALPKFFDISSDAGTAAASGVAGALTTATSINYAAKQLNKPGALTLDATNSTICSASTLQPLVSGVRLISAQAATPANGSEFKVSTDSGTCSGNPGGMVTCNLQGFKGSTVRATIICTG